jgi:nickel transport protein
MPKGSPSGKDRLSPRTWPYLIFLILVIVVPTSYALAHRVVLFAYTEGDVVFTESYFSDGKRCRDSRIEVFDRFGNKLLEGRTDKNGEFSFRPPKGTDLRIVLTASMGHRDEYLVPAGGLPKGAEEKVSKPQLQEAAREGEEKGTPVGQLSRPEMEQIRSVGEEVPDEKLKPIMRIPVKRQSKGISFIRVMGGIGFIFGTMGIILYFISRRGR